MCQSAVELFSGFHDVQNKKLSWTLDFNVCSFFVTSVLFCVERRSVVSSSFSLCETVSVVFHGSGPAEDCQADEDSFLVPIAVGVALLVLILIVVVAYFIGRKRNMATGYESF